MGEAYGKYGSIVPAGRRTGCFVNVSRMVCWQADVDGKGQGLSQLNLKAALFGYILAFADFFVTNRCSGITAPRTDGHHVIAAVFESNSLRPRGFTSPRVQPWGSVGLGATVLNVLLPATT